MKGEKKHAHTFIVKVSDIGKSQDKRRRKKKPRDLHCSFEGQLIVTFTIIFD